MQKLSTTARKLLILLLIFSTSDLFSANRLVLPEIQKLSIDSACDGESPEFKTPSPSDKSQDSSVFFSEMPPSNSPKPFITKEINEETDLKIMCGYRPGAQTYHLLRERFASSENFPALETLYLSRVGTIASDLFFFPVNLKELTLINCGLTTIPTNLQSLQSLESLTWIEEDCDFQLSTHKNFADKRFPSTLKHLTIRFARKLSDDKIILDYLAGLENLETVSIINGFGNEVLSKPSSKFFS